MLELHTPRTRILSACDKGYGKIQIHTIVGSLMLLAGSRFRACTIEGNLAGSLMRNTGCEVFVSLEKVDGKIESSYRTEEHPVKITLLSVQFESTRHIFDLVRSGIVHYWGCLPTTYANPRLSLTLSAEPRSPATVEKRVNNGVFFPTWLRKAASVNSEMS